MAGRRKDCVVAVPILIQENMGVLFASNTPIGEINSEMVSMSVVFQIEHRDHRNTDADPPSGLSGASTVTNTELGTQHTSWRHLKKASTSAR